MSKNFKSLNDKIMNMNLYDLKINSTTTNWAKQFGIILLLTSFFTADSFQRLGSKTPHMGTPQMRRLARLQGRTQADAKPFDAAAAGKLCLVACGMGLITYLVYRYHNAKKLAQVQQAAKEHTTPTQSASDISTNQRKCNPAADTAAATKAELAALVPNQFAILRTLLAGEQFDQTTVNIHNCWDYQAQLAELQTGRPEFTKQQWLAVLSTGADLHDAAADMLAAGFPDPLKFHLRQPAQAHTGKKFANVLALCQVLALCERMVTRFVYWPPYTPEIKIKAAILRRFDALLLEYLQTGAVEVAEIYPELTELLAALVNPPK